MTARPTTRAMFTVSEPSVPLPAGPGDPRRFIAFADLHRMRGG